MGSSLGYGFAGAANSVSPYLQSTLLNRYQQRQQMQQTLGNMAFQQSQQTGDVGQAALGLRDYMGVNGTASRPFGQPVRAIDASLTGDALNQARATSLGNAFPEYARGSVGTILGNTAKIGQLAQNKEALADTTAYLKLAKYIDPNTSEDQLKALLPNNPEMAQKLHQYSSLTKIKGLDFNKKEVKEAIASGQYESGLDKNGNPTLVRIKENKTSITNLNSPGVSKALAVADQSDKSDKGLLQNVREMVMGKNKNDSMENYKKLLAQHGIDPSSYTEPELHQGLLMQQSHLSNIKDISKSGYDSQDEARASAKELIDKGEDIATYQDPNGKWKWMRLGRSRNRKNPKNPRAGTLDFDNMGNQQNIGN